MNASIITANTIGPVYRLSEPVRSESGRKRYRYVCVNHIVGGIFADRTAILPATRDGRHFGGIVAELNPGLSDAEALAAIGYIIV